MIDDTKLPDKIIVVGDNSIDSLKNDRRLAELNSKVDSTGVLSPEPYAPEFVREMVLPFHSHDFSTEYLTPGPRVFNNSTKETKHCLNCNSPHTHNNSYCSAACCKEHRAVKKGYSK